jgi:hypothetical protein
MRVVGALVLVLGLAGFAAGAEILGSPAAPWICLGVAIVGLIMIVAPKAHD